MCTNSKHEYAEVLAIQTGGNSGLGHRETKMLTAAPSCVFSGA